MSDPNEPSTPWWTPAPLSVRPTWTLIRNYAFLTVCVWGIFLVALAIDPRTCVPELCRAREGHESIRVSSGQSLPILNRYVADDSAVTIDYISLAPDRRITSLCSEAAEVMDAVLLDRKNQDAIRITLGTTTTYGVSWQEGSFVSCCATTYVSLVRDSEDEWHLNPCAALKRKGAF